MKALDLHCVSIESKSIETLKRLKDQGSDESVIGTVHEGLESLLIKLHLDRPQWRFELVCHYNGDLNTFKVYQDSECLGHVNRSYIGSATGYGYEVKNDRIAEAKVRGNSYQTKDMDKAYVKIKKMFSKQSLTERINKASSEAGNVIHHNYSRKNNSKNDPICTINTHALEYVNTIGFHQFMEYVNTKAPIATKNLVNKAIHDKEELISELATIERVKNNLGTGKTAIIVKDGSSYIYKHKDKLTTYDDTTLPEEVKGKLGLLKLVETEHYIEGTGCRVNDEIFVIIMEDEDD